MHRRHRILGILAGAALLSGCVESKLHLSHSFGQAVHEDLAAQIADPDARYRGSPAPGANGLRVGLAEQRYVTGKVIDPVPASTTLIRTAGGASASQ